MFGVGFCRSLIGKNASRTNKAFLDVNSYVNLPCWPLGWPGARLPWLGHARVDPFCLRFGQLRVLRRAGQRKHQFRVSLLRILTISNENVAQVSETASLGFIC